MKRKFLTMIACAIAGLVSLLLIPESYLEYATFRGTLALTNSSEIPIKSSGQLAALSPRKIAIAPDVLPTRVRVGEDSQGVFQDFPLSPTDYAVILNNLKRLGEESVAIAFPLAWEDPDLISLTALDIQLDSIPSLITATPLTRSATPSSPPPAIRRAAIPTSQISGNINAIPIVNRIPLPGTVLGSETSKAAFTVIESEPTSDFPHLLARWENENLTLPAFALLAAMELSGSSIKDLHIELGKSIKIGKSGAIIPIDQSGRLRSNSSFKTNGVTIPAQDLVDATGDLFKDKAQGPIMIEMESKSSAHTSPTQLAAALATPLTFVKEKQYQRFGTLPTSLTIASLLSLLFGLTNYKKCDSALSYFVIIIALLTLHFCLVTGVNVWPPTLVLFLTLTPALITHLTLKARPKSSAEQKTRSIASAQIPSSPNSSQHPPEKRSLPPLPRKTKS